MTTLRHALLTNGAAALSALPADVAGAQATDPPAVRLEEITATAQRRSESAQDVPIPITAFSPAEIERRNIQSTLDLVR